MIKDFYSVDRMERNDGGALFHVRLNPECVVYKGHFPGKPVSPGVCSIGMIKECARKAYAMEFMLENIRLCRLKKLISPETHSTLQVQVGMEGNLLTGIICDGESICMELKAEIKDLNR